MFRDDLNARITGVLSFVALGWVVRKAIDLSSRRSSHARHKEQAPDERSMDGKTLEQAAWELLDKPHELHIPHELSIVDAWARERSLMSDEDWSRHISRMKAETEEKTSNEEQKQEEQQAQETPPAEKKAEEKAPEPRLSRSEKRIIELLGEVKALKAQKKDDEAARIKKLLQD